MVKMAKVEYKGGLRIKSTHLGSGNEIITDAPLDNNGKGEAFSPTDLVATALADCAITVMGIRAVQEGFDLEETWAEVEKIMASNPRRIQGIKIDIHLKSNCDAKMRKILEGIGLNCPVAKSLSPDLEQDLSFHWH